MAGVSACPQDGLHPKALICKPFLTDPLLQVIETMFIWQKE